MRSAIFNRLSSTVFNLVGVKGKIMGIAIILVLLLGSMLIGQSEKVFSEALRRDLIKQGVALGRYLSVRSENPLLTNNIFALHELVEDTMSSNPEIIYIIITNSRGGLILDSFETGMPRGLLDFNKVGNQHEYSQKTFTNEQGVVQDLAVPIMYGKVGQVRLGLSEKGIAATIEQLRSALWLSTLFISLLGITVAYPLSILLTKPLRELVNAAKRIGEGQLSHRVVLPWARDELGHLGAAFNEMAAKLENAEKEQEKLWQTVLHKEKMRKFLLNKVISAQEGERLRISRELHDETGQALSSVKMALASLDESLPQAEFNRRIKLMQITVTKALEEIHLLARQLRPSVLDKLGLATAVERFTKECAHHWGKDIGFTAIGFGEGELPPETKITAYRIVQEALTNAVRHSEAENISIVLQIAENKMLAIIEDDGSGFIFAEVSEEAAESKHLGLFGMQERADMLGGRLSIETGPGKGTTIYVELPIDRGEMHGTEKAEGTVG